MKKTKEDKIISIKKITKKHVILPDGIYKGKWKKNIIKVFHEDSIYEFETDCCLNKQPKQIINIVIKNGIGTFKHNLDTEKIIIEEYNPLDLPLKKSKHWEKINQEIIKKNKIDIEEYIEEPTIKLKK